VQAKKTDDTPRIQYWGFSYGTVLGEYFAAMFPGRVGRMILEGVEDVHDYYQGVGIFPHFTGLHKLIN
jgi:pimeloyl-ACP methyl ester carboxylesterase